MGWDQLSDQAGAVDTKLRTAVHELSQKPLPTDRPSPEYSPATPYQAPLDSGLRQFFCHSAPIWTSLTSDDLVIDQLQHGNHPPAKIGINSLHRPSVLFDQTFDTQPGDKMDLPSGEHHSLLKRPILTSHSLLYAPKKAIPQYRL